MNRNFFKVAIAATAISFAGSLLAAAPARAEDPRDLPFWNYKLPMEERLDDLMSRLTLEEKVSLLAETAPPIERLGIDKYYHGNEALHGVVRPGPFTVFPQAIALAGSWNPELLHTVATAISDEARGKNNANNNQIEHLYSGLLTFWSPTVNMARDPRWGRTAETYGEDPWLTGRMGVAFVTGLQGDDPRYLKVVSTPKHFVANNTEHNRMEANAIISERTLRDYYLPGFQACIVEAGAESIMGAYNAVNGVPCNANKKLLTDILRGDWGFDGYAVTDCGALSNMTNNHHYTASGVEAAAAAVNAGINLECGGGKVLVNNLIPALEKGLTTQEAIDRAAYGVLRGRFRLGLFDPPELVKWTKIPGDVVGGKEHQALALQMGRESIALLKNAPAPDGVPLLPLDREKLKSILVVGPSAAVARFGDYSGSPVNPAVAPLDGIRDRAGNGIEVRHAQWIPTPTESDFAVVETQFLRPEGGAPGENGLRGEYFNGRMFEGHPDAVRTDAAVDVDRNNKAPDPLVPFGDLSIRWTGKLVPNAAGLHRLAVTGDGAFKLFFNGELLLEKKRPQKAKIKAGEAFNLNTVPDKGPQRKEASLSLEAGREYDIRLEYAHTSGNAVARLEWIYPTAERQVMMAEHIAMAKDSDVVVAIMGIGLDQEREGRDKDTLDIPEDQKEYIRRIHEANPNTVVALVNGSPISVNWINENIPAVVEAWYGGEQGGAALADVLFGDYNPAGRLPVTFYKSVEELPDFEDYEVQRGRTYMYMDREPLYPFGHGLSYSTFSYANLKIDNMRPGKNDAISVSVDVTNDGPRDGDEVIQLYVHDVESSVYQPKKQLKGFKRVNIKSGETRTVVIPLNISNLNFWDEKTNQPIIEPGKFEIMVGASSGDIRLTGAIEVVE